MAEGQGRSSGQGVKLLYIRDYLYTHATKEHPKNAKAIKAYLSGHNIAAAEKTIYNDIKQLQYEFNVPIVYDHSKWGYYISEPDFYPHELRLMVDCVQASKFITQTEAAEITQKITKLADIYTKEQLNRHAFVAQRIRSKEESVVKDAGHIHEAITQDRKIAFRYFHYTPNRANPKRYSKSGEMMIVSPYALMWNDGNYYLYAYDGKIFRNYRVDRMENISTPLLEKREGKSLYHKKDILSQKAKIFRMYKGTEYTVRIRCLNTVADTVLDEFGRDTAMMSVDDNHFVIAVPVEVSPTFYAWVSTFGRRMKILAPEPVIQGMREFLQKAMDMYKDEGEK